MGFTPSDNYCNMKAKKTYVLLLLYTLFPAFVHAQLQDVVFHLNEASSTGAKIITAIREQTSFRFTYNGEVSNRLNGVVKTDSKQLQVKEALELLQRTLKVGYEANG